jgi:hypothetical protein
MDADPLTLARLLTLAALLAATIQYVEIVKRRALIRADATERARFKGDGLTAWSAYSWPTEARSWSKRESPPQSLHIGSLPGNKADHGEYAATRRPRWSSSRAPATTLPATG